MKKLTEEMLLGRGDVVPCRQGIYQFRTLFPNGVEITPEVILSNQLLLDSLGWYVDRFFTDEQRQEYTRGVAGVKHTVSWNATMDCPGCIQRAKVAAEIFNRE